MSRDIDETNLPVPLSLPLDDEDFDLPDITFKSRKKQTVLLPNGNATKVEVIVPAPPVPVFHNTSDENQIDDDLRMSNNNIQNLNSMWSAVRTVEQAVSLAGKSSQLLMDRRKLANKQLGKSEGGGRGTIYHIPD